MYGLPPYLLLKKDSAQETRQRYILLMKSKELRAKIFAKHVVEYKIQQVTHNK